MNGDGLTVSNMFTGVDSDGGSLNLDAYTSSGNTNGIIAKMVQSASSILKCYQGITTENYPQINSWKFLRTNSWNG